MKLIDSEIQEYSGTDFEVYKTNGVSFMKFSESESLNNDESYAMVILGESPRGSSFYRDSFKDFEYDKVLIAGLGLGLLPNELSKVKGCSRIDVLEISQELIDYTVASGHLPKTINLIQGDIYSYTTSKKYDLIIIDTVWRVEDMTEAQLQTIVTNLYSSSLNEGGVIYAPIAREWIVKS